MEHLVISATGANRPDAINELFLLPAKNDCNIESSRLTVMGSEVAIIMMVSGNWNTIVKVETGVTSLKNDFEITVKRTKTHPANENMVSYLVQIVAANQSTLVYEIINFFVKQNIYIDDMQTDIFSVKFTGTPMLSLNMRIGIPTNLSIADFREIFTLLCDELNIDGILEPEKP